MNEPKLTPDEYANLIQQTKPYLIRIEEVVSDTQYGSIEVRLEVRAGSVEKMQFFNAKTWLKQKSDVPENLTQNPEPSIK